LGNGIVKLDVLESMLSVHWVHWGTGTGTGTGPGPGKEVRREGFCARESLKFRMCILVNIAVCQRINKS